MLSFYQTDRLILKILDESYAPRVLEFMLDNKVIFERWDTTRPKDFYTVKYQQEFLTAEKNLFLRGAGMRYWIYKREDDDEILGSVSFSYISNPTRNCSIGYKLAPKYQGYGYATEAASFLLSHLTSEYGLKRIIADIMPTNQPSRRLIQRLGFKYECLLRNNYEIMGHAEDHLRYVYTP